jgi:hypothetical protein
MSVLYPQRAPLDERIAWVARHRELARRRASAWKHRHAYLTALLRRLRKEAAIPDAPDYEYEDDES